MSLNVVILAAGKGTRMKSDLPKVLHPVAHKPMVKHVIDTARQLDAHAINLVYGYGADALQKALSAEPLHWVLQQEQLGTGHAVQQAVPNIADDDTVLVLYGDVPLIQAETLAALLASRDGDGLAILTVHLSDPTGYGRIVRQNGAVCGIVEQKDASLEQRKITEVNSGIMAASGRMLKRWLAKLDNHNAQQEFYLTDIVYLAYQDGVQISTVHPSHPMEIAGANDFIQLAQLERFYQQSQVHALMRQGVYFRDPSRVEIRGNVKAGRGVSVDVNVVLSGDIELADHVTIGPNVVLDGPVFVGAHASVEANCVVRNSRLHEHSIVGANNVLVEETVNRYVHIKSPRRF